MKHGFIRRLFMALCLALSIMMGGTASAEGYMLAIPPRYDDARSFSEGLAAVSIGEKWGFIDTAGQEVVPLRYGEAGDFRDGLAPVRVGDWRTGAWGFIDKAGNEVIPPKYHGVSDFHEGLAAVVLGGKGGFIDMAGNEIVPPKYDEVYDFREGLARVWIADGEDKGPFSPGKWGYIDKTGKEVVPVIYEVIGEFSEGRACVVKDGKMGFVDQTGAAVIPLMYTYERPWNEIAAGYVDILPFFSEGLAAVWGADGYGGRYGYIDRDGKRVIPFEYDYAGPFSQGLAYVSQGASLWYETDGETSENRKFGYIDKAGQVVVPLEYDCDYVGQGTLFHWRFVDGLAQVSQKAASQRDMKYGMIDQTGKIVVPLRYHWLERLPDGLSFAGYGEDYSGHGTWNSIGLIDETGREIVAVDYYAWIGYFSEGYAWVRYGGEGGAWMASEESRYGFIDMAGNEVAPCIFEEALDFSQGLAAVMTDGKWGYITMGK